MTDAQLATLSQQGNREAFETLASRWNGPLFGYLRRLLGDEEAARDACQESLLRAYTRLNSLREPGNFRAWLHTIALNLCRDRARSKTGREIGLDEVDTPEPQSVASGPLEELERQDLAEILRRVLARIPLEQRNAILLREFEGFNSRQIAAITGVPAATVRSRIYYGLKTLRRLLPEHGVTPQHLRTGGTLQ
jgi:RNA polymerase sigma-70 factor (ECF subfamily)